MREREARRQFELWFADVFMDGMDDAGEWDDERNCYVQFQVHMAWKGWQASRQQALEEAAQWLDFYDGKGLRRAEHIRSLTTPTGEKA